MNAEIKSGENFLDEETKWVYADEKGVQVFALYGIGDGTDATPLYAVGGEKAAAYIRRHFTPGDRVLCFEEELPLYAGCSPLSYGREADVNTLSAGLFAALRGLDAPCACPLGFEPLPAMTQVPLIGSIACGTPITAEQNIERYIGVPAAWRADFALTCHGDSMSPTICDGDIVCIRCQPEVEQGEIAAVRIGDEATLKHFHRQGDAVMLIADNAAVCPPMVYTGPQLEDIRIEGKAVGFCRGL